MVLGIRQRIVEDTDGSTSQIDDEDEGLTDEQIKAKATSKGEPSSEAANKFTDYSEYLLVPFETPEPYTDPLSLIVIPYINDEQANAATKDPHLKLLFRLVNFFIRDEGKFLRIICLGAHLTFEYHV